MIKDKEKLKERNRVYYQAHREHIRLYQKEYNKNNREKIRQRRQKRLPISRILDREHYYRTRDRHRELHTARKYGISVEEYRNLFIKQNNLCAVCGNPETAVDKINGNIRSLALDHNHKTGEIRGLLCQNCNNAIGHLHEDLTLLDKIRNYLKK